MASGIIVPNPESTSMNNTIPAGSNGISYKRLVEILRDAKEIRPSEVITSISFLPKGISYETARKKSND